MIVFCHRHHKSDAYLKNTPVEFSVVREPMYKYSKAAQERFFEQPEFAFLFAYFAKSEHSLNFQQHKFLENTDERFTPRMEKEIQYLSN